MAWWLAIAALPPLPMRIILLPLACARRGGLGDPVEARLQAHRAAVGVADADGGAERDRAR